VSATLGPGCVAPADVKTASAETSQTLEQLDAAVAAYQVRLTAELDRIADDLRKAVVARVVTSHVGRLSADVRAGDKGLVALSREVEAARDAARTMVESVPRSGGGGAAGAADPEAAVDAWFADLARAAETTADDPDLSERARLELRQRAQAARTVRAATDPAVRNLLVALWSVEADRRATPARLAPLRRLVDVLRETHAIVHAGVMTDVRPDGAALGEVVVKHGDLLLPAGATAETGAR
jgi:hypothetical protein